MDTRQTSRERESIRFQIQNYIPYGTQCVRAVLSLGGRWGSVEKPAGLSARALFEGEERMVLLR